MFLFALIIAFASSALLPIYSGGGCTGIMVYTVNYTLGDCYRSYDCSSASCPLNMMDCSGLTLDAFHQCIGCTPQSSYITVNTTNFIQWSNVGCTGVGINIAVTNECWIDPGVECGALSVNLTADVSGGGVVTTGSIPPSQTTTTTTTGTTPSSSSSSASNVLEMLF